LVAAIMCGVFHFLLEDSRMPTPHGWLAAVAVGALPTATANLLWDAGIRHGDANLLTVLAYATPLMGAVLLALLGIEDFTWRLLIVGFLIGVAGFLSNEHPGAKRVIR
jgi:drug/metabolite transporter (DMT)-like permease